MKQTEPGSRFEMGKVLEVNVRAARWRIPAMGARITSSDLELLVMLADYRVLTAAQAAFVLDRNPAALRRRLGELADRELIDLLSVNEPGAPLKSLCRHPWGTSNPDRKW